MTTPTETAVDLKAARYAHEDWEAGLAACPHPDRPCASCQTRANDAAQHIPALLAEIKQLREDYDLAHADRLQRALERDQVIDECERLKAEADRLSVVLTNARAEVERMRPIVLAAISWREMRAGTPTTPKPESAALIAAVDDMGEVAW